MTERNTQYDAICVVQLPSQGLSNAAECWALRVTAEAVPGHSSVEHLMDLAVDLSPIEGQAFESCRAAKAAARKQVKTMVTTASGERFSAPKIKLKYVQSSGFWQTAARAMELFSAEQS